MTLLSFAPAAPAASERSSASVPPPTCEQSSQSVPGNTPTTIVLSCTDPSSQPQTIAIVSNPSHGTLAAIDQTSPTSATVTYTPAADYNGPDSFTFNASGVGTSAPATVSLTVGWTDQYYTGSPPGWVGPPLSTLGGGSSTSTGSPGPVGPPVVSALQVTVATFSLRWRGGGRCAAPAAVNHIRPDCTRSVRLLVSFSASEGGRITFTLERTTPGRREGGRCVAPGRANHTRPACVRRIRASTTRDLLAGANEFTVTDRLDRVALTPGSYELVATPVSGGQSGSAQTVRFPITR